MRKEIGGMLWMLSVVFIASCGFEIPESLTVTGTPGVHLPLGSPFGVSGQSINDYIGQDKIREMISDNDSDHKVTLYDYQGNGTELEVQTYLARYEIAKLNLDLKQHINEANDITVPRLIIPSIPGNPGISPVYITESGIFSTEPSEPLLEISLGAIGQWMTNVKLKGAGITITGGKGLKDTLKLKIPQLGIADYSEGEVKGEDLVFTGATYTLLEPNKDESKTIKVYAQLEGSPVDGTYEMALNFNWTEATLYPGGNGKFTGTYTIDFGDFTDYLGNAKLKAVPAYVFINGLPDDTKGKMSLIWADKSVDNVDIKLVSFPPNLFNDTTSIATGSIPEPSIDEIDLVDLFNTDKNTLTYTIQVTSVSITPKTSNKTITADLLIRIPLEFVVEGKEVTFKGEAYQEWTLAPLKEAADSKGDSDLFGRTDQDDDMLKDVAGVRLGFYNYTNTIIEGLNLFVGKPNGDTLDGKLLVLKSGTEPPEGLTFTTADYPFNPQFKVLVESKNNVSSFKIGPLNSKNAKLDFSLVLDAAAKIEQTVNF